MILLPKRPDRTFRFICPMCDALSEWYSLDATDGWHPYHDCGTKMKYYRKDFAGPCTDDEDFAG